MPALAQVAPGWEENSGDTFESHIFSVALFFDNGLFNNGLLDNVLFDMLFGNVMVTIDRRTVELAVSVEIAV